MSRIKFFYALGLIAFLSSPQTVLADAITYGAVSLNSSFSVQDGTANDSITNTTGTPLQIQANNSTGTTFAYNTGSGFTLKPTTSNVSASESLQTGELKSFTSVGFGTNLTGSAVMPINKTHAPASSTASFGDSFRTFSGNSPFPWNTTSTSFTLDVTGSTSVPAGFAVGPQQSHNFVQTFLQIYIFQAGGLDIYNQLSNCGSCTTAQFNALNNQMQTMIIMQDFWILGDYVNDIFGPSTIPPEKFLAVDPSTPTEIPISFAPGGDFDWFMTLSTTAFIDASLQNTSVTLDFSHTVDVTYQGPAGTTTYSAGSFSGTQPLGDAPTTAAVPEPSSGLLLAWGLIGAGWFRKKIHKSR